MKKSIRDTSIESDSFGCSTLNHAFRRERKLFFFNIQIFNFFETFSDIFLTTEIKKKKPTTTTTTKTKEKTKEKKPCF